MSVSHKISNMYYSILACKPTDYMRYIVAIAAVLAIVGGGYYGYQHLTINREQAAQKVLSDCLQEYAQAQVGGEPWVNVEQICKLGYEQHSRSSLAPYFLIMQSDALLNQQKNEEGLAVVDKAVALMDKKGSLYPLYAVKRALMYIDRGNEHQLG